MSTSGKAVIVSGAVVGVLVCMYNRTWLPYLRLVAWSSFLCWRWLLLTAKSSRDDETNGDDNSEKKEEDYQPIARAAGTTTPITT